MVGFVYLKVLDNVNIVTYDPPINFCAISLATLRHVLDSYHAITPVWVEICPTPLISHEKGKDCMKKASTRVSIFTFIILHGRKTTFFVESNDSDISKLVEKCCFRNYKEDKIQTRKLALKNVKYFGALQIFISHHNLSHFGLIPVEIKLSWSH